MRCESLLSVLDDARLRPTKKADEEGDRVIIATRDRTRKAYVG